ncbi:MAG: thiol reductant ABC exporter subunit CydC [Siculibacillus sp.]|nr:thiol reductant ABC exporter subunit CydC [Siculibacillus sp.]
MSDLLRLLRLWRGATGWLLVAFVVSTVATFANIALMAVAGWFITAMAAAGLAGTSLNYFTPSALIRAAAIVRTGGRWLDRVIGHEATFRLIARTRTDLFARLERIAPAGLDDLRSGEAAARLKGDVDRLEAVHLRFLTPLAVAVLTGAVAIAVIARHDAAIGLAAAIALAFGGVAVPLATARAARRPGRETARLSAELRRGIVDDLGGLATLATTGALANRRAEREDTFAALLAEEERVAVHAATGQAALGLSGDLLTIAVVALGAASLSAGALAGPDLTLVLLLGQASFEAFAPIPAAFAGAAAMFASLRRVFALWDREPPVVDPPSPRPLPERFDLSFERVSFTHAGAPRPTLRDFDLELPEGRHLVVVGSSGVGKSTLVDLLSRARDPDAGRIRLGGVPLPELSLEDLRSAIVVVPQNPHVFSATIAANLRLAAPAASDRDLWEVLATVALEETVARMPDGLLTFTGAEGVTLSGGEARRLAVARALLLHPRVLVLDEPTEGLDDDTAHRLLAAVAARMAARTLVIVSHRIDVRSPHRLELMQPSDVVRTR